MEAICCVLFCGGQTRALPMQACLEDAKTFHTNQNCCRSHSAHDLIPKHTTGHGNTMETIQREIIV
eukprot:6352030-Amphidinium_carterae.1